VAAADPALIALCGPTASGKSGLALELAAALHGEIVSCDSLQVYRGLDIGSAKPTAAERDLVRHHLVDVVDPDQPFSAADYARLAREALRDIRSRGRLPLVVGGTGLYLQALLHGLFDGPARDAELRARLERIADRRGDAFLHRWLARRDPEAATRIGANDRVRVVRAFEVLRLTGRAIGDQQRAGSSPLRGFDVLVLGLAPEREALRQAIQARTHRMLEAGLIGEVRGLLGRFSPELRPLQAIGYREAVACLRGDLPEAGLEAAIVTATARYAKRQMTWFRHQTRPEWCAGPVEAGRRARAFLGAKSLTISGESLE
jgi:tRNA dimethylallyltransferase